MEPQIQQHQPMPRSAREAMFGDQPVSQQVQEEIDRNRPRFFVQMGWNLLQVDTHAIPNRYLLRGEITPCRTYNQKANINEIPEAAKIPNSEEYDRDGKIAWGYYKRWAFDEADRLLQVEGAGTYPNGVVEIAALGTAFGADIYRQVDLNKLFYPDWPQLPQTNALLRQQLVERIGEIIDSPPRMIPLHYLAFICGIEDGKLREDSVAYQLLAAVDRAEFIQRMRLTETHNRMKLTPKDDGYKKVYDLVDYEMLNRTGLPEIHAAEIQTAQALQKLTDSTQNGDSGLKDLIAIQQQQFEAQRQQLDLFRQQMEDQRQLIQILLAERQQKPDNGVEKAKAPNPQPQQRNNR